MSKCLGYVKILDGLRWCCCWINDGGLKYHVRKQLISRMVASSPMKEVYTVNEFDVMDYCYLSDIYLTYFVNTEILVVLKIPYLL